MSAADNVLVEPLEVIGAWAVVLVLGGGALVLAVRQGRRARAQRRSVVAGREVVYGSALRFLLDFAGAAVVEGRVLERKVLHSGEDGSTKSYWLAVEDGRRGRIAGTPVRPEHYAQVVAGARVRLHLTPLGRRVTRLEVMELPGSVNGVAGEPANLSMRATDDLLVSPAQASRALGSPVEVVPVALDVPNTRHYIYVPPGAKVTNGTALPPALHVTEAFDPEAANEIARRATAGGRRTWHHGNRGVFQSGLTYLMTWGDGALLIRGQVDVNEVAEIGRLAYSLKPPAPRRG